MKKEFSNIKTLDLMLRRKIDYYCHILLVSEGKIIQKFCFKARNIRLDKKTTHEE